MIAQQLQEELDRSLKISRTNTMTSTEFTTSATDRANKTLSFDSTGELTITTAIGTSRGNWAASTAYAERDIVKDTSTNNIFLVNTAHTSSGAQPLTTNANSAKYTLLVDAASATTSATNAANSATAASNDAADAEKLAINAEDSQFTLSAKTTSQNYATKTDGAVESSNYSSKAWAIGGTGVTDTAGSGSAKEWATDTSNTCDGTEYSAKEYAIGSQTAQTNGSAKQWAIGGGSGFDVNTVVSGSEYSAKYWAQQAAASKTEFSNIYHGQATSDPTQDPDTSALEAGDLYFNSNTNVLRVYNGSSWQDAAVDTTSFAGQGFAVAMAIAL